MTVHVSVAEHAAAHTLASIGAGLVSRRAVGKRRTGSVIDEREALPTRTGPTTGERQAQLGTPTVVVGAAVGS